MRLNQLICPLVTSSDHPPNLLALADEVIE
jgi:hypothetical protein